MVEDISLGFKVTELCYFQTKSECVSGHKNKSVDKIIQEQVYHWVSRR